MTPKNKYNLPYTVLEVLASKTGRHELLNSSYQSEFNKFGVGVTLYFKFTKYFTLLFFLLSVISVLSMSLCI